MFIFITSLQKLVLGGSHPKCFTTASYNEPDCYFPCIDSPLVLDDPVCGFQSGRQTN